MAIELEPNVLGDSNIPFRGSDCHLLQTK